MWKRSLLTSPSEFPCALKLALGWGMGYCRDDGFELPIIEMTGRPRVAQCLRQDHAAGMWAGDPGLCSSPLVRHAVPPLQAVSFRGT